MTPLYLIKKRHRYNGAYLVDYMVQINNIRAL